MRSFSSFACVMGVLAFNVGLSSANNYVLGVDTQFDCSDTGGCTYDYSVAAYDTTNKQVIGHDKSSGVGRSVKDLCNAELGPAQVWCFGDITKSCSGYGVAAYNSRSCRTFCKGDKTPIYNINGIYFGESISNSLVCDQPY